MAGIREDIRDLNPKSAESEVAGVYGMLAVGRAVRFFRWNYDLENIEHWEPDQEEQPVLPGEGLPVYPKSI